eukprot:XP_003723963.1 PREDICTED: serine/threonine-protein kinase Nek1 [Strongylocentrotus purpuratus]
MPLTAVLRDVGVDITQPEQEMPLKKGENRVPVIPPAEENQGPAAPRKHWGGGATKAAVLANMPLEVTASNMEATNAGDMLMPKSSVAASSVEANRKKWGAPGNTVVNALQMAEIKAGTMTIAAGAGDAKGETQLLKGPAMYDRGSPMGVTVIKEQPMSPREKIPVVKDNMCVVDGKQSGDSKEAADLETIDAKNKEDAAKQTPPSPSRPAWKAASSSSPSNQTQIDSAPKTQGSPNQKDQPPTSTTKDSPKSNSTPPRPTPDAEAPPTTDKATPPKSPRPSTSPPSVKTSPPSANSPSSSPLAKSPAKTDEEKEEEKISQEKKDADAVQLDEEDEDNQDIKEKSAKKKMIAGLSTGFFDTAPKLLRTCSDPDLRQLFRTTLALNPFFEADQKRVAQSVDTALNDQHDDDDLVIDDDEDDDDEESDELIRQLQNLTAKNEEEEEEEEEKEEEDENEEDGVEEDVDEDEEEYQSLVESMRSVLEARDASDSPKMRRKKDEEEEKSPGGASNGSSPSSPSGSKDDEDEEEDEDDKENSGQSKPINEDWDSGEGSEGEESGMSAEERESVYSRLEESRLQLEKELGCDTFLKAYKSIQAMHEDEDENIEEGTKRVSTILGEGKGQVYTKILQLVMADGAYTEDYD